MTNPRPRLYRMVAILVVLLAGFGLGNVLHEVIPHPIADQDGRGHPQKCAACAALHHSWGDVVPVCQAGVVSASRQTAPSGAVAIHPASPEFGPSSPRAPPVVA